jgi:hypothetical protein
MTEPYWEPLAAAPAPEVAYSTVAADVGPVAVAAVGGVLFTFPAATYEAVKHYLNVHIPNLRANVTGTLYLQLWEAGVAVAGGPLAQLDAPPATTLSTIVSLRMPFVPVAGNHTYQVAWIGNGTVNWTVRVTGLVPAIAQIIRA